MASNTNYLIFSNCKHGTFKKEKGTENTQTEHNHHNKHRGSNAQA